LQVSSAKGFFLVFWKKKKGGEEEKRKKKKKKLLTTGPIPEPARFILSVKPQQKEKKREEGKGVKGKESSWALRNPTAT